MEKLAAAYIKYGRDDRKTNTGEGLKFVEKQIAKYQKKVQELRQELQQLQYKYLFITPEIKNQ